jgi:catechol 2,3-dioxygenase-like lactoylglutathione lyase family enzyme
LTALDFVIESPIFHTSHVVSDMFRAADRYVQLFDRAVLYSGYSERHSRRAAFALVAEVWVELVAPEGLGARFLDRFGEHQHGLAFKVRGIDALAQALIEHGVRFGDAAGRPVGSPVPRNGPIVHPRHGPTTPLTGGVECEPDWWSATIYTQMDDSCGWYEFCEPKIHHNRIDPRQVPGWQLLPVVGDPLTITGASHHTVVVGDLEKALSLWCGVLGANMIREAQDELLGTRSAFVRVGEGFGTVVEFAQPVKPGPAAVDRQRTGRDMLHRVNFAVEDLDAVRVHLAEVGCPLETETEDLVVTDPAWCCGARYGFTPVTAG